jgi:hypothetical protein
MYPKNYFAYKSLEITTRIGCPVHCVYCPQDKFVKEYYKRSDVSPLSFDTFKKCIDKVPLDVNIHFSGFTEPWLNQDCTKLLLYAFERGHGISVFTVGVGMQVKDVNLIRHIPFKNFIFHLPDKKNMHIQIDANYLAVLEELVAANISNLCFWLFSKDFNLIPEQVAQLLNKYKVPIDKHRLTNRARNVEVQDAVSRQRFEDGIYCYRLKRNILLPNGDVLLCCNDWGMKHVIGNLLVMDYQDLFNSSEYRLILNSLQDNSIDILCRYCVVPHEVKGFLNGNKDIRKWLEGVE